ADKFASTIANFLAVAAGRLRETSGRPAATELCLRKKHGQEAKTQIVVRHFVHYPLCGLIEVPEGVQVLGRQTLDLGGVQP
ncbi:MAG TPA: hypothetical protein VGY66_28135, partial [Gemmataceae bacterium]|nr:hypothetical protein [Gemmataceae bacterium]